MNTQGSTDISRPRLSHLFEKIRSDSSHRDFNIGELLEIFNQRGHGLLLLFLIAPSLTPIPIPGLGSAFGVLVALQGLAMIFAATPRLPARLARTPIKAKTMSAICNGCCKIFGVAEKFVQPRLPFLFRQPFYFLNGLLVLIGGCILTLPLILPLSNFIPALLVLFICLGTLEDDGLMILLGYAYAITLTVLFGVYGPQVFEYLKNLF